MWSDYRIKENIINDFAVICKIIGEQGLLERRGDREYLTIQAPNGVLMAYIHFDDGQEKWIAL